MSSKSPKTTSYLASSAGTQICNAGSGSTLGCLDHHTKTYHQMSKLTCLLTYLLSGYIGKQFNLFFKLQLDGRWAFAFAASETGTRFTGTGTRLSVSLLPPTLSPQTVIRILLHSDGWSHIRAGKPHNLSSPDPSGARRHVPNPKSQFSILTPASIIIRTQVLTQP